MAVSTSFKQECPSCESMVLVKDASMIGKKIECPKCKDRFVVKPPKSVDEDETPAPAQAKGKAKPAAAKKSGDEEATATPQLKKGVPAADDAKAKTPKKGKSDAAKNGAAKNGAAASTEATAKDDGKKKKLSSKKMTIGLALAVVGVGVLGVAAYFILGKTTPPSRQPSTPVAVNPRPPDPEDRKDGDEKPETKDKVDKKVQPREKDPDPVVAKDGPKEKDIEDLFEPSPEGNTVPAGSEFTNLLPHDTEQVVRINGKSLFEGNSPFREASFHTPGAFTEKQMRRKLSFSPLKIDEIILAERFTPPAWSLALVHVMENMSAKNLALALGLEPVKTPIKNQHYFQVKNNPWLEQLGKMAPGVPPTMRQLLPNRGTKPLFVRLHNPQTLVLGDESVMLAFLQEEGQFRYFSDKEGTEPKKEPKKDPMPKPMPKDPKGLMPKDPMAKDPMKLEPGKLDPGKLDPMKVPGQPKDPLKKDDPKSEPTGGDKETPRGSTFMTVKPALKTLIERWQPVDEESKDRVLFATATEMSPAQVVNKMSEYRGLVLHRPRPLWDLTCVMEERTSRLNYMATALVQKDNRAFQYRTEFVCRKQAEARDLGRDLADKSLPRIVKFLELVMDYPIPIQFSGGAKTPEGGGKGPEGPKIFPVGPKVGETPKTGESSKVDSTRLTVSQADATVTVGLDLLLEPVVYSRIIELIGIVMTDANQELALADSVTGRQALARAAHQAAVKGITEVGVPPGRFPPGAFPRPNTRTRAARDPGQRISWMAGLLPFLGHERLFNKIQFESSWRDPANWLPGRTVVPQFLDPSYPDRSRFVHLPPLPVDMAATHFVGVAGVGLDAADYRPGDPATDPKRGILGYEASATLDEVQKGRGLSNTMLMIQVPPDSAAGVTPWIAGGGSTLRGIPEKNSIDPFVLSEDKHGKPLQHKGRPGTYVLMADGSVRFVTKGVSDEVFKAMATFQGPNPPGFENNENILSLEKAEPKEKTDKKDEAPKKKLPLLKR